MRPILLSFCLGLYTLPSLAQLSFRNTIPLAEVTSPENVVLGDFDHNGFNDIAFTTGRARLMVEYNQGSGTYTEIEFAVGKGFGISPLAAGDLNKDGLADLAYFDNNNTTGPGNLVILLSTGQAFHQTTLNVALVSSKTISISDFDGDGSVDLLFGNPIQLYRGDGSGNFTFQSVPGILGNDFSLVDVDNNGSKDFITLNNTGLTVYVNDGNNSFAPHDIPTNGFPLELSTVDYDGDGFVDVALIQSNGTTSEGEVFYLVNDQTGNFISGKVIPTTDPPLLAINHLDYNHDGKEDLVAGAAGQTDGIGIMLLENTGNGNFVNKPIDDPSSFISDITSGDLGHDGIPELVEVTRNRTIQVFTLQSGTYQLTFRKILSPQPLSGKVIDLDKDGILDLVTANYSSRSVSILYGKGDQTYEPPVYLVTKTDTYTIDAADYNSDTYPDLIFYAFNGTGTVRQLGIFLSNGSGGFLPAQDLSPGDSPTVIAIDLNNDSKMDIVAGQYILWGNGAGSFPTNTFIVIPSSILYQRIADLNHDGLPDLVIADGTFIYGVLNQGSGNFGTPFTITTSISPYRVSTGDINSDGFADVVAVSANQISVLINQGAGNFQESVISMYPETNFGYSVPLLIDFDQDGRTDMAVAQNQGVKIFLQQPDGSFSLFQFIKGFYPQFMEGIDLNADHKTDIVVYDIENEAPIQFLANDLVKEPSTASSSLTISSITDITATLSLQKGNGDGRIILMKKGNAVDAIPVDNTVYTSSGQFGAGQAVGNSNMTVMNSNQTSVNVSGLQSNSTYFVAAFEYSSNSIPLINYLQFMPATASFTTKKAQTITPLSIPAKKMGDAPFQPAFTTSSGLPLTVTVISGGVTVVGTTVSILSPGPVRILVEQAGNSEFGPVRLEVQFCVNPVQPTVTLTTSGPGQFTLMSSSDTNNHWLLDGTAIDLATQKSYSPEADGTFSVKVDYSGCTSESLPTPYLITSITTHFKESVKIYPNPASRFITIEMPEDNFEGIDIFDGVGQSFAGTPTRTGNLIIVHLPSLPAGLYIAEVRSGTGVFRQKIVIGN